LLIKKIEKTICHLPENYRIIFEKSRFEDKTYPVIASELGLSVKTVEYRMTQALNNHPQRRWISKIDKKNFSMSPFSFATNRDLSIVF